MKLNAAQLRGMKRENLLWPAALTPVDIGAWPASESDTPRVDVLRSRTFLVQMFDEGGGLLRLSVNRTEWDERQQRFRDDITWDDLQRLKAEAGFSDRVAVEVFPPDRLVVDVANMRHLWVLPAAAERLPFVWGGRKLVSETRQPLSVEASA